MSTDWVEVADRRADRIVELEALLRQAQAEIVRLMEQASAPGLPPSREPLLWVCRYRQPGAKWMLFDTRPLLKDSVMECLPVLDTNGVPPSPATTWQGPTGAEMDAAFSRLSKSGTHGSDGFEPTDRNSFRAGALWAWGHYCEWRRGIAGVQEVPRG